MTVRILVGDCREVLRTLPDESVHCIVTDPPYHLTTGKKGGSGPASVNLESPYGRARVTTGFMGMTWDGGDVAFQPDVWMECLRVLKPGGHLLAFGGTRTHHRMVSAIEDAGFEIRDMIAWVYGSGFPKSMDVSKAIDKAAGAEREVVGTKVGLPGYSPNQCDNPGGVAMEGNVDGSLRNPEKECEITAPATEAAKQWQGWGTALKPAHEPICVARKPLAGTVAANVLAHGTGALNIDGCRVPAEKQTGWDGKGAGGNTWNETNNGLGKDGAPRPVDGRWPANLIHDGSDEVLAAFPDAPGQSGAVTGKEPSSKTRNTFGLYSERPEAVPRNDTGSAARFFYCAKADKEDRGPGNNHPTVKPSDLMRYLVRLVTPPGGTVLDPFAGSGSTLLAADREGFNAIGIELSPEYAEIARRRIAGDAPLFAEVTP